MIRTASLVHSTKVTAQVEFVSPALAAKYLEANTQNRRLRPSHVRFLADVIRRGEWKLTHQGISFSESGWLLDGQHRLKAIIEANQGVYVMVTRGIPNDSFFGIDQGVLRTCADVTGIDPRIAHPLRYASELCFSATKKVSPQQVMEVASCGLSDALSKIIDACGSTQRYITSSAFKLAAAIRIMEEPLENTAYVLTQYRSLVTCDFDRMSDTSKAIFKSTNQGNVIAFVGRGGIKRDATQKLDTLARGLIVFDRHRQDLTRIQVKDAGRKNAVDLVRKVLKTAIDRQSQHRNNP